MGASLFCLPGLDSIKLKEAIRFARDSEAKVSRDQEWAQVEGFGHAKSSILVTYGRVPSGIPLS